jgi:hypothetical protein
MNLKQELIDRWNGFNENKELRYWKIFALILAFYVLYLMLSMKAIIQEHNYVFATNFKTYHCWMEGNPEIQKIMGTYNTTITEQSINTSGLNVSIGRILNK